ncbi:MAG: methyltransferase domain-containing protein, partial [Treponema sp.]|nr:methyltransferase domain-containing protein [Treponema sp.]
MMRGPLLVVSTFEKGRGGGHLVRSVVLVRSLRSRHREAYLTIPGLREEEVHSPLFSEDCIPWLIRDEKTLRTKPWEGIILDCFRTTPAEFARWSALAPLIGIDEGGPRRDSFDFLMDLLPGPPGRSTPNILSPGLLPLPQNRRASFTAPKRLTLHVLVSFGMEDPAGLTLPVCLALKAPGQTAITALFGGHNPAGAKALAAAGIRVVEGLAELREQLAEYDLLVTHFGLTAFESLAARVPVILLSPGRYHEQLAHHAGFLSAGIREKGVRRLRRILYTKTPEALLLNDEALHALGNRCERIRTRYELDPPGGDAAPSPRNLGDLLAVSSLRVPVSCPICGNQVPAKDPVCARFPDRTYRRCGRCGTVYLLRSSLPPIVYERDYFFTLYKRQYGKTYLEDFPNLVQAGKDRLGRIKRLLSRTGGFPQPRVLDIGCAYGPFLVAAREEGFAPFGMDPAEDAVRYVRDELRIPAFQGFFPETPLPEEVTREGFDLISLWYVIEHFERPAAVLWELYRLLKPGGVLAFATPSGSGISGRRSFKRFLEQSPPDHWTIWKPAQTRD